MLHIPKDQTTEGERAILRQLRVWIAALAGASLAQIARAPEALSASFAEIARRVEPAVVNIDTVSVAPQVAEKKEGDGEEGENPLTCCAATPSAFRAASAPASSLTRRGSS